MDQLLDMEKSTMQQLERWSMIEESVLKQKSRATWIKLGDSNTKYFSAVVKERNHRKHIVELTSLTCIKLTEPDDIKEEIIQFYKGLMGLSAPSLPAGNKLTMQRGPMLTQAQKVELCAPVFELEIYEGLTSIGDDKAPGIDCFNAYISLRKHGISLKRK